MYFIFNTCLIAIAVALATKQSFIAVWNQNFLWSAPSYFVGAGAAAVGDLGGDDLGRVARAARRPRRSTSPIAPTRSTSAASTTSAATSRRWPTCTSRRSKRWRSRSTPRIRPRSRTSAACRCMPPSIARGLGMSDTEIQGVKTAALLHDIGKLAVPEHILSKPGPLTQEEFQKIRVHPQVGAEIISAVPFPYPVAPLILSHHERWDGKGYPQGLKGEEIPLGARILSVVDYFDALTSDRPYHKAMTPRSRAGAAAAGSRPRARSGGGADVRQDGGGDGSGRGHASRPRRRAACRSSRPTSAAGPPSASSPKRPRRSTVFEDIALAHREIYALYEIAQTMGTSLGVADTMALISSKLSNLVPFSACALFLFDEEADTLRCRFATGVEADAIGTMTVRAGQGLAGWVARNRRPLVNARPSAEFEAAGLAKSTALQSALVAPLVFSDRFIGTLAVYSTQPDFYTDDHRRLLDRVSEQASAVIHNSIVFEQTQEDSLTDPLTGLPNTRFMFMHLTRELARAERLKAEVALLVMDLDNFKEINDNHGHHVGDRALREVATVLRAGIRPYDICVRYAGDEFIVVLSGCGADEAERKRARAAAHGRRSAVRGAARAAACRSRSASARRSIPQDGDTYEALLATADSRMYRDKTRRKQRAQVQPARDRHRRPARRVGAAAAAARRRSPRSTSSAPASACSRLRLRVLRRQYFSIRICSALTPSLRAVTPRVADQLRRAADEAHAVGRRQRFLQQRFADPAPSALPAGALLACHREVQRDPSRRLERGELRAETQTHRPNARCRSTRPACVVGRDKCSINIERSGAMPVPPATNSSGRSTRSGNPNEPNGPSRSSSVPGDASSRCGSSPPLSSTWTSTCMMPGLGDFPRRGRNRIRLPQRRAAQAEHHRLAGREENSTARRSRLRMPDARGGAGDLPDGNGDHAGPKTPLAAQDRYGAREASRPLHPEDVEAGVDHQHFAGDAAARVAQQERRRVADFGRFDRAAQRRLLAHHAEDRREAADAGGRQRLHRPGGDRVDANVLGTEIRGEIAHRRFERGLRDAHHVVVREHAIAAEERQRQHAAAAARRHQRLRAARQRDQRVGADVERLLESVARGIHEPAGDLFARRERGAVHDEVEPAVRLLDLRVDRGDLVVAGDVERQHHRPSASACRPARRRALRNGPDR